MRRINRIPDREVYGVGGFIDVETTGLSNQTDEIVELSLVLFVFERQTGLIIGVLDEYTGLNEPTIPIPPSATKIHGIRNRDVAGKYLDEYKIYQMIETSEFLVAHNASFDRGFVERYFPLALNKKWYCSMRSINWRERGHSSLALINIARNHGITKSQTHRASDDVYLALEVLSTNGDYVLEMLQKPARRRKTGPSKQTQSTLRELSLPQREIAVSNSSIVEENIKISKNRGCLVLLLSIFIVVLIFKSCT